MNDVDSAGQPVPMNAGKGRLQKVTAPVPNEPAGSIRADVEEIRERARR